MAAIFELNGDQFDVDVVSLEREFTHGPNAAQDITLDGQVHYGPADAYCHYTMTVRAKPGCEEALNELWDYLLIPGMHECAFPYGSGMISQSMYVTGGKQSLICTKAGNRWGELTVRFLAAQPRRDL